MNYKICITYAVYSVANFMLQTIMQNIKPWVFTVQIKVQTNFNFLEYVWNILEANFKW